MEREYCREYVKGLFRLLLIYHQKDYCQVSAALSYCGRHVSVKYYDGREFKKKEFLNIIELCLSAPYEAHEMVDEYIRGEIL